jgi:hypothetical protein
VIAPCVFPVFKSHSSSLCLWEYVSNSRYVKARIIACLYLKAAAFNCLSTIIIAVFLS